MTLLNESQRTFASAHGVANPMNTDSIAGMSAEQRLEIANRANDPDAPTRPVRENGAQVRYRQQFNLDEDLTGADEAHHIMYQELGAISFANTSEHSAPSMADTASTSDAPIDWRTARLDGDLLLGESSQYRLSVANALESIKHLGVDAVPETVRRLVEKYIKR